MKLTFLLILISFIGAFATESYSQTTRLTLSADNLSLEEFLIKIENQSEFRFFYTGKIDVEHQINGDFQNRKITEILDEIAKEVNIKYEVMGRQIILSPADKMEESTVQQPKSISGKVADTKGQPLPGVTVVIKGTTQGTITNTDGEYSLSNISSDAILQFSFVGMKMQEIIVGGQATVNVTMEEDAIGIEEVVAVGYGVQKKVNLTGSVGVVDAEKLENRSVGRLEQALQGQVSGLKIIQTTGQPGNESISMQIRGQSTFTSNPVLTIVDGLPSSISQVNPEDIESISVLKDASSTAIYGSRAAGGVILITTKAGTKGKPKFGYNGYFGIQQPTRFPEKVSAYDHAVLFTEAELNDNPDRTSFTFSDEDFARFSSPDWEDYDGFSAAFSNAIQTQHDFSMSGGSEKQDYYISVGYLLQNGTLNNTGYNRYNIQINENIYLGDKLKLSFKGSYRPEERTAPSEVNYPGGPPRGIGNLISRLLRWPTYIPYKTSNGDWAAAMGIEPYQIGINTKEGGEQILRRNTFSGNANLEYSITGDLKVSGMYGLNWSQSRQSDYSRKMKFYDPDNPEVVQVEASDNALEIVNSSSKYQKAQFLINYKKSLENHDFSVLAGYTREWSYQDAESIGRTGFLTDNIYVIDAGSTDPQNWTSSGTASDWALSSWIGRINYSYKDKYLAEAAIRYDGSSRFLEGVRWGVFPSFSAGWRISEENFLKGNNFLSYLKLRASWGQVGNQNVGSYPFANTLATSNYYFNGLPNQGVYYGGAPNPTLTWESKTGMNIGLDGNIKGDLFSFGIDLFKERTEDILLTVPVPSTYGLKTPVQNAGVVENTGWEVELSHQKKFNDFFYRISFNVSDATNKVIDLKDTGPWIEGNTESGYKITEEGRPMYEWYGWKSEGLFQTEAEVASHSFQNTATSPGDIKYQENGGDPETITPDDRVRLGRSDPRFPFGIRAELKYKNFDLNAFAQGVLSHLTYTSRWGMYNASGSTETFFEYHLDRWTPETPNGKYPKTRVTNNKVINAQFSSFWLYNAAYFRLKNIQIGYNIPKKLLEKFKIDHARVYISGENILTFTDIDGFDPEIITNGSAERRYPLSKNYNIGVNLNF
ncbi:MAG: SusC/RagA family TonB-linked outer membrane protein [Bacteroidales bacterium]